MHSSTQKRTCFLFSIFLFVHLIGKIICKIQTTLFLTCFPYADVTVDIISSFSMYSVVFSNVWYLLLFCDISADRLEMFLILTYC